MEVCELGIADSIKGAKDLRAVATQELATAKEQLERLYARWHELEELRTGMQRSGLLISLAFFILLQVR